MNIMKSFEFCYGHRVWNQVLSRNKECACRRIHGHSGKIDLIITGSELVRGMLIDFNELAVIKEFVDRTVDHRFLIDADDPLLESLMRLDVSGSLRDELFDSLVVLPFVPTSENLALWMLEVGRGLLKDYSKIHLKSIRWWESQKSYAEAS